MGNDKTVLENETVAKTAVSNKQTPTNPKKVALVAGGFVLASGAGMAAWGFSKNGVANPEIEHLETEKDEKITIERSEDGKITAITVDSDNSGSADLKFDKPQTVPQDAVTDGEFATATKVTDTMSFSEAFAAARSEVGEGNVFVWHGKLYGTYYKEEWDTMTAEQKSEYGQEVNEYTAEHPTPAYNATVSPIAQTTTETEIKTEEQTTENAQNSTTNPQTTTQTVAQTPTTPADTQGEQYVVMGEVDLNGDGIVDAIAIDSNGDNKEDIFQIDSNNNNVVDALAVDSDYDGVIDAIYQDKNEDGVVDAVLDGQGNVLQEAHAQHEQVDLANNADFDNNADVSDWV